MYVNNLQQCLELKDVSIMDEKKSAFPIGKVSESNKITSGTIFEGKQGFKNVISQ